MRYVLPLLLASWPFSAASVPATARSTGGPPVVVVHATDFAFQVPKTLKAGPTTFRLVNDGKQLHHLAIVRLAKGKTTADFIAFVKKPAPPFGWFTEVGGPNPAVPGTAVEATLTLEPGDYAVACFIPSPGDTVPHFMKGMVASFTVTPDKSGATAPAADMTIRTSDYTFAIPATITKGHHVIAVANDAVQAHELILIQLAPGKTIADVSKWVGKDLMKGAPPGKPIGGMAALAKGQTATFPIDLVPGNYGLICFAPDAKDGKPHDTHGMLKEFTVAAK